MAVRGEQGAVVPQQGPVPRLQQAEKHDEYINEWSQTVDWLQQGGRSSRDVAYPVNKPKGAAEALALARQQLTQAKNRRGPHLGKQGAEGGGGDEASSALGTEDGPSAGQISSMLSKLEEKAMEAMQKAQENFEQAQQEVIQAQTDLQTAHAGSTAASDASSTSQCEPGQNLGSM